MAVLGLRFCARTFCSCGKRGPLFIALRGPLTVAASLVAEHKLQTRRLSNCGSRAQLLHGMWDLPRPGLEPVSPALAGRFSTTAPPGKPLMVVFVVHCMVLSYVSFPIIGHQLSKPPLITQMEQEDEMEIVERRIHQDTCSGGHQAYMNVLPTRSVPCAIHPTILYSRNLRLCFPFVSDWVGALPAFCQHIVTMSFPKLFPALFR